MRLLSAGTLRAMRWEGSAGLPRAAAWPGGLARAAWGADRSCANISTLSCFDRQGECSCCQHQLLHHLYVHHLSLRLAQSHRSSAFSGYSGVRISAALQCCPVCRIVGRKLNQNRFYPFLTKRTRETRRMVQQLNLRKFKLEMSQRCSP